MKKYPMSIIFRFVCLFCLLMSCEKDNQKIGTIRRTPCDMYRKYLPIKVLANFSIDLNFDGIENIDLTKEIDAFKDCFIYFTDDTLTIAWPEPQIGEITFLTPEIPSVYTGEDVKYFSVQRHYTYSYWIETDDNFATVSATEIEEAPQNYYTFWGLNNLKIEIDKAQNTITFNHGMQYFLTKEGKRGRQFTAIFKPD